jgi:hypothetical protein
MPNLMKKLALIACSLVPLTASADVTYTSSSSFLAAISGLTVQTEDFATFSNGQDISSGFSADGITYGPFNLTDGATQLDITNQYNSISGLSLGADHTSRGSLETFFYGGDEATITFSQPVLAVGIFFNVNPNTGSYEVHAHGDIAVTGSASYDTSTFVFAGIVSTTPFTTVSFDSTNTAVGSFNIPEIISAAPEPSAFLPLSVGGLALLPMLRRRRRA